MKIGVLTFSYSGFGNFENLLSKDGYFTVNLGDSTQSIAARSALASIGVESDRVVDVDRDSLREYSGPPLAVVMNGVFFRHNFPPAPGIHPIFLGFHASEDVIDFGLDYLRKHEPIGCRDNWSAAQLEARGVASFVSGCVTLTFPCRAEEPDQKKLFIVYGDYAGQLPPQVLSRVPVSLLESARIIYHRIPVFEFPLSARRREEVESYERSLIARYSDEASIVLTSLHHVAAPCIAMGIPIVLFRQAVDARFSFLETLLPVYTPNSVDEIDWNPPAPEIAPVRERYLLRLREALSRIEN